MEVDSITSTGTWKAFERQVAEKFKKFTGHGHRTPLSGSRSLHTAGDIIHPTIYVECKYSSYWPFTKPLKKYKVIRLYDRDKSTELILLYLDKLLDRPDKIDPGELFTLERKKWQITDVYVDAINKAHREQKIPVVVVREKYKKGDMALLSPADYNRFVKSEFTGGE